MKITAFTLLLLAACSDDSGGILVTAQDDAQTLRFRGDCALADAEGFLDVKALNETNTVGIEVKWKPEVVTAAGTFQTDEAGNVAMFALHPAEGEPAVTSGAITFDTYDPTGDGVAGSLEMTGAAFSATAEFDCR
jgi:hypothetical protein